jgi:hypothetical protein
MLNLMTLKVGDRLKLEGGVIGEVIENMDDGQWVRVRYLDVKDMPEQIGNEELAHATDILAVLDPDGPLGALTPKR